jgi:ABC-2 type transport system ATP-binding protein
LKQQLPGRLITLRYPSPAAAKQALLTSGLPYLDAYVFGQDFRVLIAPDAAIPDDLQAVPAVLTMEDVFIYYDQRGAIA